MQVETVEQFFVFEVAKMLQAEETIAMGLEQMVQQTESAGLKSVLNRHKNQTQQQIKNLMEIFEAYDMEPKRLDCPSAQGLAREYQQSILNIVDPEIKDLATALTAEKVEHQEIASYRALINLAEELGRNDFVALLKENLQQEQKMAKTVEEYAGKLVPAY